MARLSTTHPLVVVGGGPVGSALALYLAAEGEQVILLDAGASERKICGEGILPPGWRVLEDLGLSGSIVESARLQGLSYHLPSSHGWQSMRADFRGLAHGVNRAHLYGVFHEALAAGRVEVREGWRLRDFRPEADRVSLTVQSPEGSKEALTASFLLAADGLHSLVRRKAGLQAEGARYRRWGARCYFRSEEERHHVEVTLGDGVESYLTPLGGGRYGLAFLWSPHLLEGKLPQEGTISERLLSQFPSDFSSRLPAPLGEFWEGTRAIGPLQQLVKSVLHPGGRIALAGDAAGYFDALTGEGLCLGLCQARALSRCLIEGRLASYPAAHRAIKARHQFTVGGLLWLIHQPRLRQRVFEALAGCPRQFQAVIRFAVEEGRWGELLTLDTLPFFWRLLR